MYYENDVMVSPIIDAMICSLYCIHATYVFWVETRDVCVIGMSADNVGCDRNYVHVVMIVMIRG